MAAPPRFIFRRIAGNLDGEAEFARLEALERSRRGDKAPPPGVPGFALPQQVSKAIAAFATLLRAFAREGDFLWTPEPVDSSRLPPVPGLPAPSLESGPLEKLPPALKTLSWAETPSVEKARRRGLLGGMEETLPVSPVRSLEERLWESSPPAPDVAARVNHRAFCLQAARELGQALPGAALLRSVAELEAHLHEGGARASSAGEWVVKAPHSAAGRSRLRGRGSKIDAASSRRLERLLELHGAVLFEPWMDRVEDFGALSLVDETGSRFLGIHKQIVDSGGVFRGILLPPDDVRAPWLAEEEEGLLQATVGEVGRRLFEAGYRGPFGVDAWRYRSAQGEIKLQALGEINARMSFGLVARGLAARLRSSGVMDPGSPLRLSLGKALPGESSPGKSKVLPLLLPGAEAQGAAWIE
jgi:hypothetical protein